MNTSVDKLEQFLEADPNNHNILLDCAEQYFLLGDKRAREYCKKALSIARNNPRGTNLLGNIYLASGEYAEAEKMFAPLSMQFDDPAIRYNLAYAQLYQGKYQECAENLQQDIYRDPVTIENASIVYARACYFLGQTEEVSTCLNNHIQNHPNSSEALGLLALLTSDLHDFEKAIELAKQALSIDPENHEAKLALASFNLEEFELDKALDLYRHISELRPNSGRALLGLGMVNMARGELEQAEDNLATAINQMPNHPGSLNALGWVQLAQSKLQTAEATFRTAIDIEPLFGESHGGLACVLALLGKTEEAKHSAKLGKRLDSKSFAAPFAEILIKSGSAVESSEINRMMRDLFNQRVEENGATLKESMTKFYQKQLINQPKRTETTSDE